MKNRFIRKFSVIRYAVFLTVFVSLIGLNVFSDPGSLSPEQFLLEMDKTVKSSHQRLTRMHSSGLSGLGKEEKKGGVSGSVRFWARKTKGIVVPSEVTVDFIYTNYSDGGLVLDGTVTSVITDVMGRSGTMTGTIRVSGEYEGSVRHDLVITSGATSGGSYYVTHSGKDEYQIPWSFIE